MADDLDMDYDFFDPEAAKMKKITQQDKQLRENARVMAREQGWESIENGEFVDQDGNVRNPHGEKI